MFVTITQAGGASATAEVVSGTPLIDVIAQQNIPLEGTSLSVNGVAIMSDKITTHPLSDGDAIFVSRATKMG